MVYTKSRESLKERIGVLKKLGKIKAISLQNGAIIAAYDNVTRLLADGVITSSPNVLVHDTWLIAQLDLLDGILSFDDFHRFFYLDRVEHGYSVYRAKDLRCHNDFEIWNEAGVHNEII